LRRACRVCGGVGHYHRDTAPGRFPGKEVDFRATVADGLQEEGYLIPCSSRHPSVFWIRQRQISYRHRVAAHLSQVVLLMMLQAGRMLTRKVVISDSSFQSEPMVSNATIATGPAAAYLQP